MNHLEKNFQGHIDPKDYQIIYKTLYRRLPQNPNPNPLKYIHRTKNIDGKIYDEGIPTIVCKQLNKIPDITIIKICHGMDAENPAFVIFKSKRITTPSEVDRAVSRINHTHPFRGGFDKDGKDFRIIITGMNWQGKQQDFKFWEGIPDVIKKSISLSVKECKNQEEEPCPLKKIEKKKEKEDTDVIDPDIFLRPTAEQYVKGRNALNRSN